MREELLPDLGEKEARKEELVLKLKEYLNSDVVCLTYPMKLGLLHQRDIEEQDSRATRKFEIKFALIAEKLKRDRYLKDWYPTQAESELDKMMVDCVIINNENGVVPFQVTGGINPYRDRKKKIKQLYPLSSGRLLIPLVMFRNKRNEDVYESALINRVKYLLCNYALYYL